MIKGSSLLILLTIVGSSYCQDVEELEGNNVRATVSNTGCFFYNAEDNNAGYEWNKDSGNHLIYSNSFWFGAKDELGELKMAAGEYCSVEKRDFFPGAITNDGLAEAPVEPFADEVYMVSKAEIEYHVSNISEVGYEIPHGILNWPAHGDIDLNLDYNLAPFADLNGNNVYEPEIGEYPEIRGDHAAYVIVNDKGDIHTNSGGAQLGIEIHYMFYQYETDDDINNTTFINVQVINRSSQNYPEFIVGNFIDGDIGIPTDDFIGCNVGNNLIYTYNAESYDDGYLDQPGYGSYPPALGVMSLNHPMNVAGGFSNELGLYGDPELSFEYWLYMNAYWKNNSPFKYGGNGNTTSIGDPTNFLFTSSPTSLSGWSEASAGHEPNDRRMFMASKTVPFNAGEKLCYDYAVIVSRDGDSFENVNGIIEIAPAIQAFYDAQTDTYCDYTLGLSENTTVENIAIFPNPSNGSFTVDMVGNFEIELFSIDGRKVFSKNNLYGQSTINTELSNGTYLLIITQNQKKYQSKISIAN